MAPARMIRYHKTLQTSKSTAPPSVPQPTALLAAFSYSLVPTLRLLSQRTSALGHTSCTQQSSGPACGFGTAMFILPTPTSTQ